MLLLFNADLIISVIVSMSEINIVNNGNRVVVEKKNIEYINCPVSARVFMMEVMH